MTGMVRERKADKTSIAPRRRPVIRTATDLADFLVRPQQFRSARPITSPAASSPRRPEAGVALDKLPLKAMQAVEPRITKAVYGVLSVGNSVKSRKAFGGTAPQNVRAQAKRWLKLLKKRR